MTQNAKQRRQGSIHGFDALLVPNSVALELLDAFDGHALSVELPSRIIGAATLTRVALDLHRTFHLEIC